MTQPAEQDVTQSAEQDVILPGEKDRGTPTGAAMMCAGPRVPGVIRTGRV